MIECTVSSLCAITCDSETASADFRHCMINFDELNKVFNITFAGIPSCLCMFNDARHSCNCNDNNNFSPINCYIVRPTQTQPTLLTNTEVLATNIPFTTTTITTVTNTTNSSSIVSVVVTAVTVTTLLCIIVATGSALLCALYMKKRKQALATYHSDSMDQQKYTT